MGHSDTETPIDYLANDEWENVGDIGTISPEMIRNALILMPR